MTADPTTAQRERAISSVGSGTGAVFAVLAAAVAIAFLASLVVGPAAIGVRAALAGLLGQETAAIVEIIQEVRLPRALLGLLIGATLGLAGAALQGFLRNPLAEPGLIGVSGSAAFGAVVMLYYGVSSAFALALPLGGMAGALAAVLLIQTLAGRHGGTLTLILAGIAVSSLAGAATALALNFAPSPFAALEIVFWMLGALTDRSLEHVWLAGPFMLIGWAILATLSRPLDALTLGEDAARSLGFRLGGVRARLVFGVALSVGAATSVAGVIGFVGLIVPHVLRPLVGHRPSRLLPASALGGAALVLAADVLIRIVTPAPELKLGVVTAIIGAPFFLWLVWQSRRAEA